MRRLKQFWLSCCDFIVGDDWIVAAGVVGALIATALLAQRGLNAWWLMPVAVAVLVWVSISQEARQSQ
jgi:hypothetical protein